MPSLIRLLVVVGVLSGFAYGAVFALATMVTPKPREITVTVPQDKSEFKPDLNATNWNALPGDVVGASNTASKTDALTSSNRFYRVRVLP